MRIIYRIPVAAGLLALAAGARPIHAQAHDHAAAAPADSAVWTAADAAFMAGMVGHHAQAIQMARLAPTHGASPVVARLAERIAVSQRDEIALMRRWLAEHGQPVPPADPDSAVLAHSSAMHAGMDHGMMPGMLAPEQMRELGEARGAAFDRLFLSLMIRHHRGAVQMVQALFATPGAAHDPSVFRLASGVSADQTTEISRMQRLLAELTFGVRAP
jgi:uncharacterized protein (DUF305 family)